MANSKQRLRNYHVTLKLIADVSVQVSAQTPEDALVKGREIVSQWDELLKVDDISEGSAELTGVYTID